MYISLYDKNIRPICQPITHITGEIIERVWDFNTYNIKGYTTEKIENAVLFTVNEDNGKQITSGLVKKISQKDNTVEIIGRDFREIFDTDVLLDFMQSYPYRLGDLIDFVLTRVKTNPDVYTQLIAFTTPLAIDNPQVYTQVFGVPDGRLTTNAYDYLMGFLKYYMLAIQADFNWITKTIDFKIIKTRNLTKIKLGDFVYDLTKNEPNYNKCVAGVNIGVMYEYKLQRYVPGNVDEYESTLQQGCQIGYEVSEIFGDGRIICSNITPATWEDVLPLETQWSETRPSADVYFRWQETGNIISPPDMIYYYLDKNNNIVESDEKGNIPNRYYPVKTKYFIADYLANAQYQAVLELCNQRYVDNLYLDANSPLNPIDLTYLELLDMVEVYDNNNVKLIPVSEKIIQVDSNGINHEVKLGFKKDKLTEILKAR